MLSRHWLRNTVAEKKRSRHLRRLLDKELFRYDNEVIWLMIEI